MDSNKEPEVVVEEVGTIQEEPRTMSLQDALRIEVARLGNLTFNTEEVKKFGVPIATTVENLNFYINSLDQAEREARAASAKIDDSTIEEVKRYEEADSDGHADS